MRFTTHTQVMVIALIVLSVMFFISYYYGITADRTYQTEKLADKELYIARLLSMYHLHARVAGDWSILKAGIDSVGADDDVAYVRVLVGGMDMQTMAQGYRPDLVSRRLIALSNEGGKPIGQLTIGFWNTPRRDATTKLTLINLVIVGDMLVLFGLALHLLLKEIVTRPLENFVEATKRIAQGDFDSYLDHHIASSEQERLALSFNSMLDHLRSYRDRLQRANEELEERVRSRTHQLLVEKGRSETILTSVADGVYTVDQDWKITTFNPAAEKITGQKKADVLGKECWEVLRYPFCKSNCLLKRLRRDDQGEENEIYVEEFEKKGASFIVSGAPLYEPGGKRAGGVESIKDITYVKQLHDQIRQADKLSSIGILAAGVAHEINNPLSNIRLYSQILSEDSTERSDTSVSSLRNIMQETDRATKIVRNLLEFSRQGMPELVKSDLKPILEMAVDILKHQLQVGGVQAIVQIPDNLPQVWADRASLQQVFINLLTNAQHAMRPRGGTVRIRGWNDTVNMRVVLSFQDSGCGIDPENLDRIFDPFFTTKEVGEGTGLGLAISYGIIKDHGGDVRVKSRPGEGAEFLLSLPPAL
ncbi:MAG: PAS domain S-box protein [Candidatus Wallbacteria bacterium]|nr:PAS domain S-box protein [Candidatus Wallbacteria bacterium]